ncbi:MAG TPA: AraC family transcriptional regulator [Opitutaceae bacterium]|nr:AraC family transcriptional regulator [Opitutaceae bacterium]
MGRYHGNEIAWVNRLVQTRRVKFGRVRYLPGGYCGPRLQQDYQLVVIEAGEARVRLDREEFELPVGEAVLFRPGHTEHFVFSPARETVHVWCSIRADFLATELRRRLDRAPRMAPCSDLAHRMFAFALGCRAVTGWAEGTVVEYLGLALFAEYLKETALWSEGARQEESLHRATAWMEEHFGEEDCLRRARQAARCSPSGLNQKFRQHLGSSPGRHLWRIRTERGAAMLRATGLTVAEIAAQCGFKNPFHFSRAIRRSLGASPREVRRQAWRPA